MTKTVKAKIDYTVCLVLPGGGALGRFQVGAYGAMREKGILPEVLCCISIGAINGAIIAGNKPEDQLDRLAAFWDMVEKESVGNPWLGWLTLEQRHRASFASSIMFGRPGFFSPRPILPQFARKGTAEATSYYDTQPLKDTLNRLVDFDRINSKKERLLLGACVATSGQSVFFDNTLEEITVEHVMASAALPPGFPGQRVERRLYQPDGSILRVKPELFWDHGVRDNNALDPLIESVRHEDLDIYVASLFNPNGPEPLDVDDAERRAKEIQYGCRIRETIARAEEIRLLRLEIEALRKQLPSTSPERMSFLAQLGREHQVRITAIEYDNLALETAGYDADFDGELGKIRERQGLDKMLAAIARNEA